MVVNKKKSTYVRAGVCIKNLMRSYSHGEICFAPGRCIIGPILVSRRVDPRVSKATACRASPSGVWGGTVMLGAVLGILRLLFVSKARISGHRKKRGERLDTDAIKKVDIHSVTPYAKGGGSRAGDPPLRGEGDRHLVDVDAQHS